MKQRPKIYHTETDKSLMWDRWHQGESLNAIDRYFGRTVGNPIQTGQV